MRYALEKSYLPTVERFDKAYSFHHPFLKLESLNFVGIEVSSRNNEILVHTEMPSLESSQCQAKLSQWVKFEETEFSKISSQHVGRGMNLPIETSHNESYEFDGTNFELSDLNVDSSSYVHLSFELNPKYVDVEPQKFSETYPSMPMLTELFGVYQMPDGFHVTSSAGELLNTPISGSENLNFSIYGVPGCLLFFEDGNGERKKMDGVEIGTFLKLGRGVLKRNWQGEISLQIDVIQAD
jgi:hypothetical protein